MWHPGHLLLWAALVGLSSRGCGFWLRRYLNETGVLAAALASPLGGLLVVLCRVTVFWSGGLPNPWTALRLPHGIGLAVIGWLLWDIARLKSGRQIFSYANRWQRGTIAALVPVIASATLVTAVSLHWGFKLVGKHRLQPSLNALNGQVVQRQDLK